MFSFLIRNKCSHTWSPGNPSYFLLSFLVGEGGVAVFYLFGPARYEKFEMNLLYIYKS